RTPRHGISHRRGGRLPAFHVHRCAPSTTARGGSPRRQRRRGRFRHAMTTAEVEDEPSAAGGAVTLGLQANWRQFALLVVINAFVGGMIGIERTVVPLIGAEEFGIGSTTLVVSFIVS